MNNPLVKLLLFGLLLMLVFAPFGGLAPLMLLLFGFGTCWIIWSLMQAFWSLQERREPESELESSKGES